MKIKVFFAVLIGKMIRLVCRVLRKGGTASPGRIALKICPDLLKQLSEGVESIIITGTNGKSTSVRMVEEGFKEAGVSYFANLTGANLIEGIATDFIINSTLSGKCRKKYAILETDELASKEVCRQLQPKVIFVTNLFVDQVDRFGGVQGTHDGIGIAIGNAYGAILVLNADDSVSASLGKDVPNRTIYYGISEKAARQCGYSGSSDVKNCILCSAELEYSYMTFSHLGAFKCPACGYSRPAPDYAVSSVNAQDLDHSEVTVSAGGKEFPLNINLPAMYNIYNALGSLAAMEAMGISRETAVASLSKFTCGFGRMESLPQLGKKGAKMVLVKNGAGCDQVLEFLKKYDEEFILSIYLNNNVSDGVDITWIDTVNFELLNECRIRSIYVSGMRGEEMTARLLKAGIDSSRIIREPSCPALISALKESDCPVFILPTYTGMMATRSEIVKQCGGTEYWER